MLGPGLHSWGLSSGVKFKLCSHPDTPRTKLPAEAELCWSKEIRCPLRGPGRLPCLHMRRKASWRSKRGGPYPTISVDMHPEAFSVGSVLAKCRARILGRDQGPSPVWKKKQHNWLSVNKDPESLSCISDLNHLFISLLVQDAATPFRVCISVLLLT